MKDIIKETLKFQDLTEEEKQKRGILGRLYGPCASIIIPTRNGRFYSESLWENQFANNDILKELISNGGVPMELDHPADREETCSDRIAAMMPELPKKDKDGHLICYVDIIDTPMGKIAYQLAKYGFNLGISSRGNGDLITDDEGNEAVDPDTYDLQTFDLVLVPAVKDARLKMVESLQDNKNYNALKVALTESLNNASKEDRKIMKEALDDLGIKLNEGINTPKKSENINNADNNNVANDNGTSEIIKSLTEALKDKSNLENEIKKLQEQLAVRDSEVNKLKEDLDKYKSSTSRLSTLAVKGKDLSKENSQLKESIAQKDEEIKTLKAKALKLIEMKKETSIKTISLNESLTNKNNDIKSLQEKLNTQTKQSEQQINKLKESLEDNKKQFTESLDKLNKEVTKQSKLAESYKQLANNIVESYIESKAVMLGRNKNEIKNQLPQKYTLKDIDRICENLQSYSLRMGKLPFDLREGNYSVEVKAPKDTMLSGGKQTYDPDDISGIVGMLEK